MRVIIVDDEKAVINTISGFIKARFPEIEIIATAQELESAYMLINKYNPELVFLDIHLPDGNSLDFLLRFNKINFRIIFITGHEEFAIKAFKFSAIDYILKPIDFSELSNAIGRARAIIDHDEEQVKIHTLLENYYPKKILKRIILRTSDFLHVVKVDDIIRCESDNNYTFFYLNNSERILVSKTIKEYTELLKDSGFVRVHQSHLINPNYINKYVKTEGGYLQMKDDSEIPVSLRNKDLVYKILDSLLYQ